VKGRSGAENWLETGEWTGFGAVNKASTNWPLSLRMSEHDRQALCDAFNRNCEREVWPMRADASLAFGAASLLEAHRVWREKAAGRATPSREDMSPRSLKPFLTEVALHDIVYDGDIIRFRSRVTGTEFARTHGSGRGRFIDEAVPSPFRERWTAMLKLALDVGGPVRVSSRIEFQNRPYLQAEILCAPLGQVGSLPDTMFIVMNVASRTDVVSALKATAL
jgi:hypothetical protein